MTKRRLKVVCGGYNVGSAGFRLGLTVARLKTSRFHAAGHDDEPNAHDSNVCEGIKYLGEIIFRVFIKRKNTRGRSLKYSRKVKSELEEAPT